MEFRKGTWWVLSGAIAACAFFVEPEQDDTLKLLLIIAGFGAALLAPVFSEKLGQDEDSIPDQVMHLVLQWFVPAFVSTVSAAAGAVVRLIVGGLR